MSHDNPNSDWKIDTKDIKSFPATSPDDKTKWMTDSNGNSYPIYSIGDPSPTPWSPHHHTVNSNDLTGYTYHVVDLPIKGIVIHDTTTDNIPYSFGNPDPRSVSLVKRNYISTTDEVQFKTPIKIDPIQYLKLLNNVSIVHKAYIIYEDLPNEISIRIEMLANTHKVDGNIMDDAEREITVICENYRITNCDQINLSMIYTEVII
jgi:hypothetical protein